MRRTNMEARQCPPAQNIPENPLHVEARKPARQNTQPKAAQDALQKHPPKIKRRAERHAKHGKQKNP